MCFGIGEHPGQSDPDRPERGRVITRAGHQGARSRRESPRQKHWPLDQHSLPFTPFAAVFWMDLSPAAPSPGPPVPLHWLDFRCEPKEELHSGGQPVVRVPGWTGSLSDRREPSSPLEQGPSPPPLHHPLPFAVLTGFLQAARCVQRPPHHDEL